MRERYEVLVLDLKKRMFSHKHADFVPNIACGEEKVGDGNIVLCQYQAQAVLPIEEWTAKPWRRSDIAPLPLRRN